MWPYGKVRLKVKLFLCSLTEHQAMEAYWGSGVISTHSWPGH